MRDLFTVQAIFVRAVVPAAMLLMGASSALAQKAGTYTGTNDEGDEVQVLVQSQGGGLAVTAMSDGGAVYCHGVQAASYGVEVGLSGAPITDGAASISVFVTTLYYASDMTFSGSSVKGTIEFAVPLFTGTTEPPKKACAAKTKKQHFTATLTSDEVHAPAPGTVVARPIAK